MKNSKNTTFAIKKAIETCDIMHHEFVTPEHVLCAINQQQAFRFALGDMGIAPEKIAGLLDNAFAQMECVPDGVKYAIEGSEQFSQMMSLAIKQAQYAEVDTLDVPHIIAAMLMLEDSNAAHILNTVVDNGIGDFMNALVEYYSMADEDSSAESFGEDSPTLPWRQFVTCLNDTYQQHNPLIGRAMELERTIQVLCRKDKNNPLHG